MATVAWLTLAVGILFSADEAVPPDARYSEPGTFLSRVLQQDTGSRAARPAIQCIYYCADTLIEMDACPDGSCPVVDCNSRSRACPTR